MDIHFQFQPDASIAIEAMPDSDRSLNPIQHSFNKLQFAVLGNPDEQWRSLFERQMRIHIPRLKFAWRVQESILLLQIQCGPGSAQARRVMAAIAQCSPVATALYLGKLTHTTPVNDLHTDAMCASLAQQQLNPRYISHDTTRKD